MYMAICTACEGYVASACADNADQLAYAQGEARRWEARGDVAVVVTYDPVVVPVNPFPLCSCSKPRAHIRHPEPDVKWQKVGRDLPPPFKKVLIGFAESDLEDVFAGFHDGARWLDMDGFSVPDVTHWADVINPVPF